MTKRSGRAEKLGIGWGGWVEFRASYLARPVILRFAEREGRLVPVDLFFADDSGIEARTLRDLPIGRIESWVNRPEIAERVRAALSPNAYPGVPVRTLASHYATTWGSRGQDNWVARSIAAQFSGSKEPAVSEASRRDQDFEVAAASVPARLAVPRGRSDHGEDFYRRFAELYMKLARDGQGPAGRIAEANNVPVSTVHRWAREARRRGLLAAGRQGKAG